MVEADGRRIEVRARAVVNATGVWSDDVRALDEGTHPDSIRPAKGIHITVPWAKVRNDIAVVVPGARRTSAACSWCRGCPTDDGGFELTYIGTTDTDYDGPIDDPQCTADDVAYLLKAINLSVREPLTEADVLGTWAGLRPLVKAASSGRTADLSRRHKVTRSESGVVTVTGGKLTTYREMAEDTVDVVVDHLDGLPRSRPPVPHRPAPPPRRAARSTPKATGTARHLADRYGSEAAQVQALVDADPALGEPLVAGLPYLRAEAVHAVRHEMATTVDDVLARRTRARLQARDASAAAAPVVAALLGRRARLERRGDRPPGGGLRRARRRRAGGPGLPATRRRSGRRAVTAPHDLPAPGPGAPTAADRAPRRRGRGDRSPRGAHAVAVPDAVIDRLSSICPVTTDGDVVGEASRDWWPQAMIWALDGQVAARAGAVVSPTTADAGRRGAGRVQRGRSSRSPRPPAAAACAARRCRCTAASCSTSAALSGIVDVDATSLVLDVAPGTFGDHLEHELRADHGLTLGHWPQSVALSTVGGWLACRSAGQLSTRYGKIEDMVLGLDVALADGRRITTGGAPAGRRRPRPQPALRRLGGHARHHHRRPAPPAPGAHPRAAAPPTPSRRSRTASTRCAASCSAAARRRCSGSTTPPRPTAPTRPATARCCSCSTRARRPPSTPRWSSSPRSCRDGRARRRRARRPLARAPQRRRRPRGADLARATSSTRWRSSAAGATCPRIYADTVAALQRVEGTLSASAHQSHSYTDGGCLYFTFAAKTEPDDRDRYYRDGVGRRHPRRARGRRRAVAPPRRRPQPQPLRRRGARPGLRRARRHQGRARPERHPQPRQARPPLPLRTPGY